MAFERAVVKDVLRMFRDGPQLLHVLIGARQVGKTTAAEQIARRVGGLTIFAAADAPLPPGPEWIESQWARARLAASSAGTAPKTLLVLDEIQKVRGWSETVKRLWDEDRRGRCSVRVLLLGSSALLLTQGLTESLAGRFFLHRLPHWSFTECREAFGLDLAEWLYFGGYPGAVALQEREAEWRRYVVDALIETVIARDILQLQTVTKPALLRHLFALSAAYPAQTLSYNKMLGQLQDAGNTTTLAHYLRLLETAFLVSGLEKYARGSVRTRGSSPKLILWNQALICALSPRSYRQAQEDSAWWGRLVENAVGGHLMNNLQGSEWSVSYWREANREVDFVVSRGASVYALEVKSGRSGRVPGLDAFRKLHPKARALIIGGEGIPLEEFLSAAPEQHLA
jgi:predicted AAA+ superfamily ATPase